MIDDIKNSKHPLIIFAPPSADSQDQKGKVHFKKDKDHRMGHPGKSFDLALSDNVSDENNTIREQRIVSEGRKASSNRLKSTGKRRLGSGNKHERSESRDNKSSSKRLKPRRVAFATPERCTGDTETPPQRNQGPRPAPPSTGQNFHPTHEGPCQTTDKGQNQHGLPDGRHRMQEGWSQHHFPDGPYSMQEGWNQYCLPDRQYPMQEGWNQYRLPDGRYPMQEGWNRPYPTNSFYHMQPFPFFPGNPWWE